MRPKKTLAALQTLRVERMAEAARDVGHELPLRRSDVLNEFRRGLEELAEGTPADSYARGFCNALEHVTAAFMAEASREEDLHRAKGAVAAKPRWTKVLRALVEGHFLPGDISSASGMPPSSVTRALQELEEASLIERTPPSVELDGRQRPCVLTGVGTELAHRILQDTDPKLAVVRAALPVIMNFYSSLISQRRVASIELLQLAETKIGWDSGARLVQELFDAAKNSALVVGERDVAIAAFEGEGQDLPRALMETRNEPLRFHPMKSIVAHGTRTYVRSGRWQYLWEQWARIGRLDHVITLNSADLQYGPPLVSPYQVLYDDPVMANRDAEQESFRSMLEGAEQRLCLVPASGQVIHPSFKAVQLSN